MWIAVDLCVNLSYQCEKGLNIPRMELSRINPIVPLILTFIYDYIR